MARLLAVITSALVIAVTTISSASGESPKTGGGSCMAPRSIGMEPGGAGWRADSP